jgi:hypothetical protein
MTIPRKSRPSLHGCLITLITQIAVTVARLPEVVGVILDARDDSRCQTARYILWSAPGSILVDGGQATGCPIRRAIIVEYVNRRMATHRVPA